MAFAIFKIGISATNILMTVGAMSLEIEESIEFTELKDKIHEVQAKLKAIGIDLDQGTKFFKPIAESIRTQNMDTANISAYVLHRVTPSLESLRTISQSFLDDDAAFTPFPGADDAKPSDGEIALTVISNALMAGTVIMESKSMYDGIKKYKAKVNEGAKEVPSVTERPISGEGEGGGALELTPGDRQVAALEIESSSVNASVPTEPSLTRMEKFGAAMDGVMFVLGVVSLVMSILSHIKTKDALVAQKAALDTQLAAALESAKKLTKEEAELCEHMPAYFQNVQDHLLTVRSFFVVSHSLKMDKDSNKAEVVLNAIDKLVTPRGTPCPYPQEKSTGEYWTNADMVLMNNVAVIIKNMGEPPAAPDLEKNWVTTAQRHMLTLENNATTSQDAMVKMYIQITDVYKIINDNLSDALGTNFNQLSSSAEALVQLKTFVGQPAIMNLPGTAGLDIIVAVLKTPLPSLSAGTSEEAYAFVLQLIANYIPSFKEAKIGKFVMQTYYDNAKKLLDAATVKRFVDATKAV